MDTTLLHRECGHSTRAQGILEKSRACGVSKSEPLPGITVMLHLKSKFIQTLTPHLLKSTAVALLLEDVR